MNLSDYPYPIDPRFESEPFSRRSLALHGRMPLLRCYAVSHSDSKTSTNTKNTSGQATGTGSAQVSGENNNLVMGNETTVTNQNKIDIKSTSNSNNKTTISNKDGTINNVTNNGITGAEASSLLDKIGGFVSSNLGGSGGGGSSGGGGTNVISSPTPAVLQTQAAAGTNKTAIGAVTVGVIVLGLGTGAYFLLRKNRKS